MKHTVELLLECARALKENCAEHDTCDGCPFSIETENECAFNHFYPEQWDILEREEN